MMQQHASSRGGKTYSPSNSTPRLSPVEIKPPKIERSLTGRVVVVDPPRIDATQIDVDAFLAFAFRPQRMTNPHRGPRRRRVDGLSYRLWESFLIRLN